VRHVPAERLGSGASFPSGHSIAASVTVLAMVIVLVQPGRRRVAWGIAAVTFAVVMALSRAYLGAHWLSDATAGLLFGISCAMITATAVDQAQRRYARPAAPAAARSVPSADRL
jgi:undecaprenyl-diphosphatase